MADIELVIKIPEEWFNRLQDAWGLALAENVREAIVNGTPLPKGHGRLIDADELKKIIRENDALYMAGFNVNLCDIDRTPTIIEADKAESEDKE